MKSHSLSTLMFTLATVLLSQPGWSNNTIELTSAGPIAFGPKGILLVSDPMAATIYAVETGDSQELPLRPGVNVPGLKKTIAGMLASQENQIQIRDLAVNPQNGNVYLSVARDNQSIILKVDAKSNKISEFELAKAKSTQTRIPNAAKSQQSRRGNPRLFSITDMAFINGQVYVAGLSNEEFASNLRAIQYPFSKVSKGSSIEIYHGAHGKYETRSPVRTFAAYEINGEMNLLAAYTCTPLVRIPVKSLSGTGKVKGTTVAELGNRNRPLDMVVYKKNGKDFILMANSSRGVMKVNLERVSQVEPITTRVSGGQTAGVTYQTIEDLKEVTQLDGLGTTHAVILIESESGSELKTIALP
ncbi:MAG: hypothetical protein VX438_06395 [Planctomycetota bacterium]|nr:hypothetical protein [Planctomycetota bacterium]